MEMHILLRLLIVHFVASAALYRKIFPGTGSGPLIRLRWVLISSVIYAFLLFAGLAAWHAFWVIPGFFVLFAAASYLALLIKTAWVRLLCFQLFLLSAVVSLWLYMSEIAFVVLNARFLSFWSSEKLLLVLLGFFVLIWPAGHIIGLLTEPFRRQLNDDEVSEGLARAGIWIGCIERTIIYIFVLSNFVTAIAFLVTAKSIFRFGEVGKPGNRKEAEYILIGTLMSFAVAMVVGYIIRYCISSLE